MPLEWTRDYVHSSFLSGVGGEVMTRIYDRIRRIYKTRNEAIVAGLVESAGALPAAAPEVVIRRKAAEISTLMASIHGGDWRVEIDHQAGFVLVAPRLPD